MNRVLKIPLPPAPVPLPESVESHGLIEHNGLVPTHTILDEELVRHLTAPDGSKFHFGAHEYQTNIPIWCVRDHFKNSADPGLLQL